MIEISYSDNGVTYAIKFSFSDVEKRELADMFKKEVLPCLSKFLKESQPPAGSPVTSTEAPGTHHQKNTLQQMSIPMGDVEEPTTSDAPYLPLEATTISEETKAYSAWALNIPHTTILPTWLSQYATPTAAHTSGITGRDSCIEEMIKYKILIRDPKRTHIQSWEDPNRTEKIHGKSMGLALVVDKNLLAEMTNMGMIPSWADVQKKYNKRSHPAYRSNGGRG